MADGAQASLTWGSAELRSLFDAKTGVLDRRVLSDEAIYGLELERIFARGWNFMCHDSQIPQPGDYFINYIGEDQVICVRGEDGQVNVLLNTCRHRGNALCRAEQGKAKSFVCSYHGWNYGLDGRLIGVPGMKAYYKDDIDRAALGLHKARAEDHLGFWFATLAPDAPSLHDYLGVVGRTGLGMIAAYGDVEVVDGIQKNVVACNWKIAVDNLFDWYHVAYSHASANTAGILDVAKILHPQNQMVMLGEYGHAIGGPGLTPQVQAQIDALSDEQRIGASLPEIESQIRMRPKAATELMGPAGVRSMGHPNLFPNLWITLGGLQACLRLPKGPSYTELWWFTFVPKGAPPSLRRRFVQLAGHLFGPAGLLEQDDGENWSQSTRSARGVASRTLGQHIHMGLGKATAVSNGAGEHYIETAISEHGQRWFYQGWTEWMTARDWAELKATRTPPPEGVV